MTSTEGKISGLLMCTDALRINHNGLGLMSGTVNPHSIGYIAPTFAKPGTMHPLIRSIN